MRRNEMTITIGSLILLILLSLLGTNAHAFIVSKTRSGNEIKWFNLTVPYSINADGGPYGSSNALQASMQTWTDVAGADLAFSYAGTTSSTAWGENDGKNIVCFGNIAEAGVLAQNILWYNSTTGQALDSDIEFNTNFSWSTDGSSNSFDVQNVGTHELGHSVGLADLYGGADSEKTMYGYSDTGETKQRTLEQDDIDGIVYLYPGITTTTTPSSTTTTVHTTDCITIEPNSVQVSGTEKARGVTVTFTRTDVINLPRADLEKLVIEIDTFCAQYITINSSTINIGTAEVTADLNITVQGDAASNQCKFKVSDPEGVANPALNCETTFAIIQTTPTTTTSILVTTTTTSIPVNNPPNMPSNPYPAHGVTNASSNVMLLWDSGDPDNGDNTIYDVYLGVGPEMKFYMTTTTGRCEANNLEPSTSYKWKVVAMDNHGGVTEGPIWTFTTEKASSGCAAEKVLEGDTESLGVLRQFRDEVLGNSENGKALIKFYYEKSPLVVKLINKNPELKDKYRTTLKAIMPSIRKAVENKSDLRD